MRRGQLTNTNCLLLLFRYSYYIVVAINVALANPVIVGEAAINPAIEGLVIVYSVPAVPDAAPRVNVTTLAAYVPAVQADNATPVALLVTVN